MNDYASQVERLEEINSCFQRLFNHFDSKGLRRLIELTAGLPPSDHPRVAGFLSSARKLSGVTSADALRHFFVPFQYLYEELKVHGRLLPAARDGDQKRANLFELKVIIPCLRSAHNAGSIYRSAECFGANELILGGYTPDITGADFQKVSMTKVASMPVRRVVDIAKEMGALSADGYEIVALELTSDSGSLYDFCPKTGRVAVVVGHERHGVLASHLKMVDRVVEIPLYGNKHSLNVSNALAVMLYEVTRHLAC